MNKNSELLKLISIQQYLSEFFFLFIFSFPVLTTFSESYRFESKIATISVCLWIFFSISFKKKKYVYRRTRSNESQIVDKKKDKQSDSMKVSSGARHSSELVL